MLQELHRLRSPCCSRPLGACSMSYLLDQCQCRPGSMRALVGRNDCILSGFGNFANQHGRHGASRRTSCCRVALRPLSQTRQGVIAHSSCGFSSHGLRLALPRGHFRECWDWDSRGRHNWSGYSPMSEPPILFSTVLRIRCYLVVASSLGPEPPMLDMALLCEGGAAGMAHCEIRIS